MDENALRDRSQEPLAQRHDLVLRAFHPARKTRAPKAGSPMIGQAGIGDGEPPTKPFILNIQEHGKPAVIALPCVVACALGWGGY
jgi:hypothetical protein